ncbi:peptidase C11, clostripain [Lachnospiraceae bacterium TWA4]|nr:peptidase C11, clostripain [Lachnospiraceae bacterium TWA4]
MTSPNTLSSFIKYCAKNYPANRNELIFWNHGGGSVTGYGYDEKNPRSGSMSLSGINKALKSAGTTFDFIGFDACLMATVETALMLDDYADYLIGSEETEPGIGWYYTNWLNQLSKNPSMSTVELGKIIADDFVSECDKNCKGQKTTLSVIDLAEASTTIPSVLADFSKSTTDLIKNDSYKTVSNARYKAREFAQSSAIDQVDLVHLAKNIGSDAGNKLSDAILSAVKYNQTSSNMTNAYGLSVYFPAKKAKNVDTVVNTYKEIGIDEEYSRCIQTFASMSVSGQAASGGTTSALPSLLGSLSSQSSDIDFGQIIGNLVVGQLGNLTIEGLTSGNMNFFSNKAIDTDAMASYIEKNHIDASKLIWSKGEKPVLELSEDEWSLVQELELNVYYDDGKGFIDLGLDNVFEFDDKKNLVGSYDNTWLAINGQPVAYYYESTVDDGKNYTITGHVPAYLNGERVNLMLVFDNEHPHGIIVGAEAVYKDGQTNTVAKSTTQLQEGDKLDFICDYYSYDGTYQDSYYLGEQLTVTNDMEISNVNVGEKTSAVYRLTDIYGQNYWTEVIPK